MSLERFLESKVYAGERHISVRECLIHDFTPFIKIATKLPPAPYVDGRQIIPSFLQAWGNFGKFLDKAEMHIETQEDVQKAVQDLTEAEKMLARWFDHIKNDVNAFVVAEGKTKRANNARVTFHAHQMLPAAISAIKSQLLTYFGGTRFSPKSWEEME